jgi:hypothetical protein
MKAYQDARQRENEKLAVFYKRMENLITQLHNVDIKFSNSYYGMDFIRKLHAGYADLLLDIKNKRGRGTPKNLAQAYSWALEYVVRAPTEEQRWTKTAASEVAMVTSTFARRGGKGDDKRGPKNGKNKPEQDSKGGGSGDSGGGGANTSPGNKKSRINCWGCGKPGHVRSECPEKNGEKQTDGATPRSGVLNLQTYTTAMQCMKAASRDGGPMGHCEVGLDGMSTVNLVRDAELLTNIRPAPEPVLLQGAAGEQVIDRIGDMGPFGMAWYHPDGIGNVVSSGLARRNGWKRSYDNYHDEERLSKDGWVFYFSPRPGCLTYTTVMHDLVAENLESSQSAAEYAMPLSVEERQRLYSARELVQMDKVERLAYALGYPPLRVLVKMVRNCKIKNCDVEVVDVLNAAKVHVLLSSECVVRPRDRRDRLSIVGV